MNFSINKYLQKKNNKKINKSRFLHKLKCACISTIVGISDMDSPSY